MPVDTLHHFTVLTDDMTRTTTFFKDVLGFTEGFTPKVDFKLTWLYAGEVPVIHVVEKDDPGAPGCARVDHVAFRCSDYLDVKAKLDAHGAKQMEQTQPGIDVHQIFVETPEGVWLELIFDYAEYCRQTGTPMAEKEPVPA